MTSREKRALTAQGMDWRAVEAARIAERDMCQLDFSSRVLSVKDGQVRLALEGLTPELALTYHTVAAMYMASDGRVPRGKVLVPWPDLERFLRESVGMALDGQVLVQTPDGQTATLQLEVTP